MRNDRPRLPQQRDIAIVDIPAVRREQARAKEAGLVEKRRRTHAVVPHHEVDLGHALRQMNRVSEIVLLGERADGLQQLGRRGLGERRRGKHADASLPRAVPGGKQIVDALQTLVPQPRREPWRFAPGETFLGHRPGHVFAVSNRLREHAAQAGLRERRRRAADAVRIFHNRGGPGLERLERADGDHQRAFFSLQEPIGLDGEARGIRKAEILVEATLKSGRQMHVTVDETRQKRFPTAVVDVGVGTRGEDGVCWTDRRDPVALDRERHVVLHGIDVDDGRMSEDNGTARRRLSPQTALFEHQGCRAGSGASQQLPPAQIHRAVTGAEPIWRGMRRRF